MSGTSRLIPTFSKLRSTSLLISFVLLSNSFPLLYCHLQLGHHPKKHVTFFLVSSSISSIACFCQCVTSFRMLSPLLVATLAYSSHVSFFAIKFSLSFSKSSVMHVKQQI
ncbi:hypothetical protein VIGAN_09042400 [Vigna angularis var. angularis]|uniref:Uncharacterized protein n=1 Tax=Vigna angularis var. angularis TaxID=157739 RepID=A0A0S3SW49_PHAAN|nr:hypothetical protein VIGAN_09042400 [Vigna angularis var. angularis]